VKVHDDRRTAAGAGAMQARLGELLLLVVMVLALFAPTADAQTSTRQDTAPLVQLPRGSAYELRPTADPIAIAIPLRPTAGVRLRDLQLVVLDATHDAQTDAALDDVFALRFALGGGRTPLLKLRAADPQGLEQGTYTLLLSIISSRAPRRTQRVPLTVVVPAAELRQPKPQSATSTVWLPWQHAQASRTLTLTETGNRSWVAGMTMIGGDTGTAADDWLSLGRLASVPRSGSRELELMLKGDFPVGDTKGSFELSAPQLATPLTVEYTLTKRLQPAWIVLLALLGAGLGTFTRGIAVRYGARAKALEHADALLGDLKRRIAKIADPQLKADFQEQADTLARAATKEQDGAILSQRVEDTQKALAVALDRHTARIAHVQQQISNWHAIIDVEWRVPADVRKRLESAGRRLRAAEDAVAGDDATKAAKQLAAIDEHLATVALRAATWQWRADTRAFALPFEKLGLPADSASHLLARSKALLEALDDPDIWSVSDASPSTVLMGLDKVAQLRQELMATTTRDVATAIRETAGAPDLSPAALARLDTCAKALHAALPATVDDSPADLLGALDQALEALRAAIAELARSATDVERAADIGRALDAHRYAEATRHSVEAPSPAAEVESAGTEQRTSISGQVAAILMAAGTSMASAALERSSRSHEEPGAEPSPDADGASSKAPATHGQSALAKLGTWLRSTWRWTVGALVWFAQTSTTAILVAIAALVLFRGTWAGTFDQIVAVFLWGYGLNLTADALVALATKSPPPASPTGAAWT
jgi:hypothetical protein